jgi:hypothetical protein
LVPNYRFYDSLGAYIGETIEEAQQTLEKRETNERTGESKIEK